MPFQVYNSRSRPQYSRKQDQDELNLDDFALFNEDEEPFDVIGSMKRGMSNKRKSDIIPDQIGSNTGLSTLTKIDLNNNFDFQNEMQSQQNPKDKSIIAMKFGNPKINFKNWFS